ncbi:MAG: hypothetical protein MUF73_05565 [Rhodobacteraceae bacterium]|jgi:hypothetical protein|nr:hypothetical protein [Paracoccaceae bacterium]
MTAGEARIVALRAEIARLEASIATEGCVMDTLRRDLEARRADLASAFAEPTTPTPQAPRAAAADDDELFDDVPV